MIDRAINALAVIAGILLCVLTALICVDVASRSLKLFTIDWTLEASEYLLYGITFLTAPWVLRTGGHISIDLLVGRLGRTAARRVSWCANLLGAVICLVMLYYSLKVLVASYAAKTLVYKALVFPEWLQFTVPPVTFVLMLVVFLRWLRHPAEAAQDSSAGL